VARLLSSPPAGWDVERPAPDVLVLRRPRERLVIRPSGTEPKLKAYLEVVVPVPDPGALGAAQDRAQQRMDALRDEVGALLRA
jgi:phosphomannomutase